jgi:hypothetical protein
MLKTMLMLTLKMKPRLLKPLRTRQSLMPLMLLLILPRPRVILPRRLTKMQKLTQRKMVHLLKKRPQLVLQPKRRRMPMQRLILRMVLLMVRSSPMLRPRRMPRSKLILETKRMLRPRKNKLSRTDLLNLLRPPRLLKNKPS